MLLDITFLFKFSSSKYSSNTTQQKKNTIHDVPNFIIDDELVTAKLLCSWCE